LKEGALDLICWRSRFETGHEPVARQTKRWMNYACIQLQILRIAN